VRLGWGADSPVTAGAHVVVWCDALPTAHTVPVVEGALLAGTTGSAAGAAQWILALQEQLADRAVVAVVAAGTDEGGFAVEDFLAAGAVIDALATVGIDFTSPEAASASAAYESLRNATLHLTSASETGQRVDPDTLARAKSANAQTAVKVLREFSLGEFSPDA
jgi:2-phosphosulfolactate phosphatase